MTVADEELAFDGDPVAVPPDWLTREPALPPPPVPAPLNGDAATERGIAHAFLADILRTHGAVLDTHRRVQEWLVTRAGNVDPA